MNYLLVLIPLTSALLGLLILRLAVWTLFHPLKPVRLFGTTFQGIIPAKRHAINDALAEKMLQSLPISSFTQKFSGPGTFDRIRPVIDTHMDEFLEHRLQKEMPMIAMFIGEKTIASLKVIFIKEIEDLFPRVMTQLANQPSASTDISSIISQKIADVSTESLHHAFRRQAARPLRRGYLIAFLVGLLTGLLQLGLLWLFL